MTQEHEGPDPVTPRARRIRVTSTLSGQGSSWTVDGIDETLQRQAAWERQTWRVSPEHKRWIISAWVGIVISFVILAGGIWLGVLATGTPGGESQVSSIATATAVVVVFIDIVFIVYLLQIRRDFDDKLRLGLAKQLGREERDLAEGGLDLESLWKVTQTRISLYHSTATSQARRSFNMGQLASGLGFFALIVLGVVAARSDNGTAAIAASVVGVAGAAIGGYISTTFMKTQAHASDQLTQYFVQPVDLLRALSAERLLDKLDPNDRASAVKGIIDGVMGQSHPQDRIKPAQETG